MYVTPLLFLQYSPFIEFCDRLAWGVFQNLSPYFNRATLKRSFYVSFCPPSNHPSDHKKLLLKKKTKERNTSKFWWKLKQFIITFLVEQFSWKIAYFSCVNPVLNYMSEKLSKSKVDFWLNISWELLLLPTWKTLTNFVNIKKSELF